MSQRKLLRPTLLLTLLLATLPALAQSPAPTFTIATSNVAVSRTGTGSIPYTLTAVNGYIGTVVVRCEAPTVPAGVSIPYCGGLSVASYNLNPSDPKYPVFNGSFALGSSLAPAGFTASRNPLLAIFFVVALLSGLTLRRKTARRLTLPLFFAVLAGLCCTTGCGNTVQGFTPGAYTYVISATQTPVPLVTRANATVTVQ